MTKQARMLAGIVLSGFLAGVSFAANRPDAQLLNPADYQSFVGNWVPDGAPLCAAIQSQAQWSEVLRSAPTMGPSKPFAPPADFWKSHAVLLIARVINAGDTANVFHLKGVERTKDAIEVNAIFTPTPAASSTMKWYLAVSVAKPLPALVRFRQEGAIDCALDPASGQWLTPTPSK